MCCISDIQYDRFQVKRDVRVNSHLKLLLYQCLVFSDQGHLTTVFCKISVRRSKYYLQFSIT